MFVDLLILGTLAYAGLKAHRKKKRINAMNPAPISVVDTDVIEVLIETPSKDKQTPPATKVTQDDDPLTVDQHYTLASISLGLSASGTLVGSSLLNLLSVPVNLYNSIPNIQQSYEAFYEEKKGTAIVYTLMMVTTLGTGHYLLASFIDWSYYLNAKLTERLTINLRKMGSTILNGQPTTVWIQNHNIEVEIPFEQLRIGDVIIVQHGDIIPVDGIITEGQAEIFQLHLSKEENIIEKTAGDSVSAWTLVMSGSIYVRVAKIPDKVRYQAKYEPA